MASLAIGLGCALAGQAGAATLQQIKARGYMRVAVANEMPYGYMNAKGEAEGAGPEVAAAVLKRMGISEVEWVVTQFGALIPGLKAGRFDMVAAEMAILPARCKQVLYSEPNTSYGEGLLVPASNPDGIHGYGDFKTGSRKVAIMAGADQLDMMQKLGVPEANLVTINSNADAISTVVTGRAAAYAATGLTVGNLAGKSDKVQAATPFTDPVVDGKPARSWGGFTFGKASQPFRDAFNLQLAAFKKTPEWKRILAKYGFSQADIDGSFRKSTQALCSGG
ncbi:ectoine/hydroxyectoine ABC transporter substrate-binding protein EhuB [Chromobacterium phragmitis]|nr:ectoine/hydroxyectoine ABC transporter substrate-binding protein EhuB [Chromobacterium phragmitis]